TPTGVGPARVENGDGVHSTEDGAQPGDLRVGLSEKEIVVQPATDEVALDVSQALRVLRLPERVELGRCDLRQPSPNPLDALPVLDEVPEVREVVPHELQVGDDAAWKYGLHDVGD